MKKSDRERLGKGCWILYVLFALPLVVLGGFAFFVLLYIGLVSLGGSSMTFAELLPFWPLLLPMLLGALYCFFFMVLIGIQDGAAKWICIVSFIQITILLPGFPIANVLVPYDHSGPYRVVFAGVILYLISLIGLQLFGVIFKPRQFFIAPSVHRRAPRYSG